MLVIFLLSYCICSNTQRCFQIYSLSQIIQGYEEDDPDLVKQGLSSSFIRSMDVAYAKLARDLSLPNVTQATSSEKPDKVEPPIVQSPIEEDEDNELDRLEAKMNAMRAQEEMVRMLNMNSFTQNLPFQRCKKKKRGTPHK